MLAEATRGYGEHYKDGQFLKHVLQNSSKSITNSKNYSVQIVAKEFSGIEYVDY